MGTSWWKKIYTRKETHIVLTLVFFISIFALTRPWNHVDAASEVISCNATGNRTISVGTYTDSDGTQFSDGADLTLNVGTGGSCTFTLNLLGTDTAINLNSLTISNGVTLTHDTAVTTDGTYYKIDLNIATFLTVETGASINASEKGLLSTSYGSGYGFSPDGSTISIVYGSGGDNGGSHGGYGGKNNYYNTVSAPYDSVSNPQLPGTSGGAYSVGSTGGGVIRISAASSTIDGTLNANGKNLAFNASGAGGTVYLNVATEILGSGSITANGGAGASGYGAGGGGRIALYYTSLSGSITFEASGGNSAMSGSDGGAGTIFKKPAGQTYGDIVLDNASSSDVYYATPLVYPLYASDSVSLYGGAYIFNSLTLSNYAVLDISSYLDPNGTGASSGQRKIYIANTASCTADYNDTSISNGQLEYNIGYVADPSSFQSNYVCVAPEYVIGFSSTSATGNESVATGTFEVVLPALYSYDITIDYAVFAPSSTANGAGVDYTLANGTLTIAAGDTTNTVEFAITDDTDQESSETFVFQLSNPSFGVIGSDSRFSYTITDNDTPGVTINEGTGVSVSEGSVSADTYSVVLDSAPSSDVIITPHGDAQVTTSPSTITFTSSNWNTPQTISVLAIDDGYAESSHSGVITHSVSSTDLNYEGLSVASVTSTISDNDFAGVTVSASGGSTVISENGVTDTYTLRLNTIPTSDVTISVSSDAQASVSPSSVTFTSANWNVPQTITLTAVDDSDTEGSHWSSISHSASSADTSYDAVFIMGVFASVIDNETAAISVTVSGASTAVREGSTTDTYSMNLEKQPTANVVITPSFSGSEITISPSTLTFTPDNWLTPQNITITAVDDVDFEGSDSVSLGHSVVSEDGDYDGISIGTVSLTVYDNDGFTITHSDGTTEATEGGATDSFTIVPSENPFSSITITLSTSTEYTLSSTTLNFTMTDWSTPQEVTVTAIDDEDIEGNQTVYVSSSMSSFSFKYANTILSPIPLTIIDNDALTPGVTLTESSGSTVLSEAGTTDSYTLVLNTVPTSNVAIALSSDSDSTLSTSSIVFTTSNWNVPQTITVTAVDDAIAEGSHASTISHVATSIDGNYDGVAISSVTSTITDNDTAGFTVSAISGNTTEAGGTATFTVVLTSQPTALVTTTVHSSDTTEGLVNTSTLVFSTSDWNISRTVTVTGVDDALDDGDISYSIILDTASSTDENYSILNPDDVSLSNTNNDSLGITVSAISGNTTEAGGAATFSVVLGSEPSASVSIPLASSNSDEGTLSTSSIVFSTSTWNIPRTVTVTGVDDSIDDGNIAFTILTSASVSDDVSYNNINPNNVSVTNEDNDTAGFTVSAISGNTTEAGGTATFTVVLNSEPTGVVTTTVHSSDTMEGTITTSTLVFAPTSWNLARTVTVTGINDDIDDGDIAYSIILDTATSSDSNYNGVNPNNVSITNMNDDIAGVTLSESDGETNVIEGADTDTYTLVLDSQPTNDVTVTLTSDAYSTVSTNSLVFTALNWNLAQTITVTAVDDAEASGTHSSNIHHVLTSLDANYDGLAVSDVSASITDNDISVDTSDPVSHNGSNHEANNNESAGDGNRSDGVDQTPENANPIKTPIADPESSIPYTEQTLILDTKTPQEVKVGNEIHHVTRISASNDSATIIIQSTPVQVTILKNETKLVDTNGDKKNDMSVSYYGFVAGLPQFVFQDITLSPDTRLFTINSDALFTSSTQVLLTFQASSTAMIAISNSPSFVDASFQAYRKTLFWTLAPGEGNKTVYVRFQRKNGYLFDASDSIYLRESEKSENLLPLELCKFALGRPIKSKDSPAVYLVEKPHDENGMLRDDLACAKRIFTSPAKYFSYFGSWKDIQLVSKSDLESIPNDTLKFIPFGPRFTPMEGTLFKTISDSKVYIFFGAEKHWIETETVFRAAGYLFDWVKTVVNNVAEAIPGGKSIVFPSDIPAPIQGKNTPVSPIP